MKRKLITALLISPLAVSVVMVIAVFSHNLRAVTLKGVIIVFLLYGAFAYIAEVILGLPAYFIYRSFNWTSLVAYVVGGAMMGLIAISLGTLIYSPFVSTPLIDFLLCIVAGAVGALVFRSILGGDSDNVEPITTSGEI
jgi:hypothetical protein